MASYLGKPHGQGDESGRPQARQAKSLMEKQRRARHSLDFDGRPKMKGVRFPSRTLNGRGR